MHPALTIAAALLIGAILNRMSGDDTWMRSGWASTGQKWLPGRPLFYTAIALAIASLLFHSWPTAVALGASFLVWRTPAWGFLFGLGRFRPSDREPSRFETLCLEIAGGDPHGAFFLRHLIMIVPGISLIGWLNDDFSVLFAAPAFALIVTLIYEIGWRLRPQYPIYWAELMTGAFWGGCVLALAEFYGYANL